MADCRRSAPSRADGGEFVQRPIAVDFDITVVNGEAGHRLAVLQAEVILDVLTWLHAHQHVQAAGN